MKISDVYYVARKLRFWVENKVLNETSNELPFYHLVVLRDIVESPNTTVLEISKRLSMAQSMISKAVAELYGKGYVESTQDKKDGRRRILLPSEKINDFLTEWLTQQAEDGLQGLLQRLNDQERGQVLHSLELLYDVFKSLEVESGE